MWEARPRGESQVLQKYLPWLCHPHSMGLPVLYSKLSSKALSTARVRSRTPIFESILDT
jgi:hypothetical protein